MRNKSSSTEHLHKSVPETQLIFMQASQRLLYSSSLHLVHFQTYSWPRVVSYLLFNSNIPPLDLLYIISPSLQLLIIVKHMPRMIFSMGKLNPNRYVYLIASPPMSAIFAPSFVI